MNMRLDKYLKVSRIFKRRSVSKNVISFGNVTINNRKAKPASEIKENDLITLILGNKIVTIKVLSVKENIKKDEALSLYEIIDEKVINTSEDA